MLGGSIVARRLKGYNKPGDTSEISVLTVLLNSPSKWLANMLMPMLAWKRTTVVLKVNLASLDQATIRESILAIRDSLDHNDQQTTGFQNSWAK